jgi:RNase P/RNase MRP subunit p29
MNRKTKTNTIITRPFRRAVRLWLGLALLVLATQAWAHEGFDHVIGTVVKAENNVLTVKTAKGNVDVKLNAQTEITTNDQKAQVADLKPGSRVVVDIPEGSKDRIAHSVKIGVISPTSQATHK